MRLPLAPPLTSLQQARQDVEHELESFYSAQQARAGALHNDYRRLWDVAHEVAQAGGKRLRPYLLLLAYQGAGGPDYGSAVRAAAAVEMLHIALLIHDDIIDRDSTRHGQLNLSGRYQVVYKGEDAREAAHYADGAAMLAGDLGISAAYQLLLSSSFSPEKQVAAMRLLGDAIFDVAGGQLLDMEASLQDIQKPDSLKIAQLKTSSYSFVAPLAIGATLAGASAQTLQALAEYGDALGIAFQLADDILGLFGNESVTGKSTTTDVAEGKPTFLMQQAVARSSATDRAELLELLGDHSLTSLQLQRARKLVRQSGALEETERRIASYAEAAHAAAARAGLHEEAMHALYACIAQATRRDR